MAQTNLTMTLKFPWWMHPFFFALKCLHRCRIIKSVDADEISSLIVRHTKFRCGKNWEYLGRG